MHCDSMRQSSFFLRFTLYPLYVWSPSAARRNIPLFGGARLSSEATLDPNAAEHPNAGG
jgi:hypothetical protein